MKISYDDTTKRHEVNGEGTRILSKNKTALHVNNLTDFTFKNLYLQGTENKTKASFDTAKWIYQEEINKTILVSKKASVIVFGGFMIVSAVANTMMLYKKID